MEQVLLIAGIIIAIITLNLLFYSSFVAAHKADETIKKKTDEENEENKD